MFRQHQIYPGIVVFACLGALGAASPATAAPFPVLPADGQSISVQKADWVPRCWWKQTYWGPQQVCRQVWVEPYGYGFYGGEGWGWRHHHHHRHHNWEDGWRRDD